MIFTTLTTCLAYLVLYRTYAKASTHSAQWSFPVSGMSPLWPAISRSLIETLLNGVV